MEKESTESDEQKSSSCSSAEQSGSEQRLYVKSFFLPPSNVVNKLAPRRNSYTYSENTEAKLRQQKLSKRFDKEKFTNMGFKITLA